MHERGLAHRDLTPTNIQCLPDGMAKILDWESAVELGAADHQVVGGFRTVGFYPDQCPVGAILEDIYALGVILLAISQRAWYKRVISSPLQRSEIEEMVLRESSPIGRVLRRTLQLERPYTSAWELYEDIVKANV